MLLRRCSRRGFCCALRRRAERQHDPVRRASDHQSATCREARRMTRALLRSGASRMPASRMTNSFREIRFRIFSKRIRGVAVTRGEQVSSGAVFPCARESASHVGHGELNCPMHTEQSVFTCP